jgi:hypothetical protein
LPQIATEDSSRRRRRDTTIDTQLLKIFDIYNQFSGMFLSIFLSTSSLSSFFLFSFSKFLGSNKMLKRLIEHSQPPPVPIYSSAYISNGNQIQAWGNDQKNHKVYNNTISFI